jgi:hypothetical protein
MLGTRRHVRAYDIRDGQRESCHRQVDPRASTRSPGPTEMLRGPQETRLPADRGRARVVESLAHQGRYEVRSQGEARTTIHWTIPDPRASWTFGISTRPTSFARWSAQRLPRVTIETLRIRSFSRLGGRASSCGARLILQRATVTHTRHTGDPTSETIHSSSSRAVGAPFATGGYLGARERDAREPPRAVHDVSFRFEDETYF